MKSGHHLNFYKNHRAVIDNSDTKHISTSEGKTLGKVMPDIFHPAKCEDIERTIWDYSFDIKAPDTQWLKQSFSFFNFPSSEKQIASLVYNAVSLTDVYSHIMKIYTKADEKEKAKVLDALVKARAMAISHLDVDIRTLNGSVIKGMAETITNLGNSLYPGIFQEKVNKAERVVPVESKEQKREREEINIKAVNSVFDAIKQNNATTPVAIQNFKEFVRSGDRHPLNRIHLLHVAFETLAKRSRELSFQKGEDTSFLRVPLLGKLADQFCFQVIGDAIEMDLSPRVRQMLKSGVYFILTNRGQVPPRNNIDRVADASNSDQHLGINYFYDDNRRAIEGVLHRADRIALTCYHMRNTFLDLYQQLYQHQLLVPQQQTTPHVKHYG